MGALAIFLDTGVLYALHDTADVHHLDAAAIVLHALRGKWGSPYFGSYVTVETTLMLKSRLGWAAARAFPGSVKEMGARELVVDEETHRKALGMFAEGKRELSVTDAASVLLMYALGIGAFATFDSRSFGGGAQEVVGDGYSEELSDREKEEVDRFSRAGAKGPAR
ncbi:MAG: PIN domain-containing protein [Nitrososphaerota archaeon]|nr:PIN domain-containing protein [Nitrososphaerota archaeon]